MSSAQERIAEDMYAHGTVAAFKAAIENLESEDFEVLEAFIRGIREARK